jgi:hypothetical protein
MIRLALLLAVSCTPVLGAQPPAALPYYLGFIVCSEASCDERFRAIYVESATTCTTTAVTLLPQLVRDGEEIVEWWCQ